MPIPAGAGLIAAVVHFAPEPINHWSVGALWSMLLALLSFLMISTIRYPSFKEIDMRKSHLIFSLLALLVALIYLYSQVVLILIATVYATSGFIIKIYQIMKHRNEAILPSENLVSGTDESK